MRGIIQSIVLTLTKKVKTVRATNTVSVSPIEIKILSSEENTQIEANE